MSSSLPQDEANCLRYFQTIRWWLPEGCEKPAFVTLLIQSVLILAHWNLPRHLLAGDRLQWGEIRPWQGTRSYSGHPVQG